MEPTKKTAAGILAATIIGVGGGAIAVDMSVETVKEEAGRYDSILKDLDKDTKIDKASKDKMKEIQTLLKEREKGNEPTLEEWQALEATIDDMRLENDTPFLQRLDRMIETMDAGDKKIRDDVVEKLKNYDKE